MPDMLLDPAKTRLIIIGVGETGPTDAANQAFSASAKAVSEFFQNRVGLREDDVHSGSVAAEMLLADVSSFLANEKPDNVFVFVFAHGKMHEMQEGKSLRSALSFHSEPNPSDGGSSPLDFQELAVAVTQRMESKRAVFIVDSCFSGLCHSIVEGVSSQKTDVLVITSNSREHVGVVKACEKGGKGGASVFTREFLKVVKDGLSEDGAEDRPLLSLEDICKHLRKEIPETGLFDGIEGEDQKRHLPSCSSWRDEDVVKTCGIFRNYRCGGSPQAQLLDVLKTLYRDYSDAKKLKGQYDEAQAALKRQNEQHDRLSQNFKLIINDLREITTAGEKREEILNLVSMHLDEYGKVHTDSYKTIQDVGSGLQQKLDRQHAAIDTVKTQLESFRNEVGKKLKDSDANGESLSQYLREHLPRLDEGLKAVQGDVAEKLKTDLRTVSAECARWRKLAWTLGICSFAGAVAVAAFAYVLVSGAP